MELYQEKPEVEIKGKKEEDPKNKLAAGKWEAFLYYGKEDNSFTPRFNWLV